MRKEAVNIPYRDVSAIAGHEVSYNGKRLVFNAFIMLDRIQELLASFANIRSDCVEKSQNVQLACVSRLIIAFRATNKCRYRKSLLQRPVLTQSLTTAVGHISFEMISFFNTPC